MKNSIRAMVVLATVFFACGYTFGQTAEMRYHVIDSLQLGGEGGWDYLAVDTSAEQLYVSRGTHVQVVDLTQRKVKGDIPNTQGVHGIALVAKAQSGFTSNGRDSSVTVFDLKTLTTLRTLKIDARNPDAILYDAHSDRLLTFNGGSQNATVIDPGTCNVLGTIPLGGKPEFAVADGQGGVFVNIEDKSELVKLDPATMKELKRWSLAPGEEPSGLAIDRTHHRLFSVCGNKLMVVSDAEEGKVVGTVPIGSGTDGAGFDSGRRLAFSSNGDGTVTVVREKGPMQFSAAETVTTSRGARTMVVDERTHLIYTVSARFGPPPAPTAERPHPRPPMIPGSAMLYVVGSR
jgi:DNA-binding beta-propeller fold protein YncE